jgi:hypothetical protein
MPFLDQSRFRYFTKETGRTLFERAKWFVLDHNMAEARVWKTLSVESDLGTPTYAVAVRPPALILFEANTKECDVLCQAFLVIEAFFPMTNAAPLYADLLRFNEIFRYWRCPFDRHASSSGLVDGDGKPKPGFAEKELKSIYESWNGRAFDESGPLDDLYSYRWEGLLGVLLDDENGAMITLKSDVNLIADDRAFTVTFAVVDGAAIKSASEGFTIVGGGHKEPGLWVKLLNVDRPYSLAALGEATAFECDWANKRTYKRWAGGDYPTLYGFSEHSFAILALAYWDNGKPVHGEPELALHTGQFYFDVTLLLLYVKATLFRLSAALHGCSADMRDGKTKMEHWDSVFSELRTSFMQFEDLYKFPLLSNQQQHLEMFALQRDFMDIEELYSEVRTQIQSSDEVIDNHVANEQNRIGMMLNHIAGWGLGFTILLGALDTYLGSVQARNTNWPDESEMPDWIKSIISPEWSWLLPGAIFAIILLLIAILKSRRITSRKGLQK